MPLKYPAAASERGAGVATVSDAAVVVYNAPAPDDDLLAAKTEVIREADMQELSTSQRILLRVVVVVVIVVILTMFGLIERHPAVVY